MTNDRYIQLCHIDEIPRESTRGFSTDKTGASEEVFIVNQQGNMFGYINRCPHTGAPLEWMPDQFLSLDGETIQCSLHGARFTIDEGHCIQGPCAGQGLTPIKLETRDNVIYWCRSVQQ